jgi:hypothetical protein
MVREKVMTNPPHPLGFVDLFITNGFKSNVLDLFILQVFTGLFLGSAEYKGLRWKKSKTS